MKRDVLSCMGWTRVQIEHHSSRRCGLARRRVAVSKKSDESDCTRQTSAEGGVKKDVGARKSKSLDPCHSLVKLQRLLRLTTIADPQLDVMTSYLLVGLAAKTASFVAYLMQEINFHIVFTAHVMIGRKVKYVRRTKTQIRINYLAV
jgi:hypothetical protein